MTSRRRWFARTSGLLLFVVLVASGIVVGYLTGCTPAPSTRLTDPDASLSPTPDATFVDAPVPAHSLDISLGTMSLSAWDFGGQVVGQVSPTLILTVTNDTQAVSSALVVSTGVAFPIDAASTCALPGGVLLAPGASCSILVRFAPLAEGLTTHALSIDAGPDVGQVALALSGTGQQAADLDTEPAFVDFGAVEFGQTATATLALVNSGPAIAITSIDIGNPIGSGFSLASTTCGATLDIGARCELAVAFSPSALGQDSADLTIATDHGPYRVGANWLMGEGGARLIVQTSGPGSVASDGGGVPDIDCGPDCSGLFVNSLAHQLEASTAGSVTWGGAGAACSGTTCPVVLSTNGPTIVTATFGP